MGQSHKTPGTREDLFASESGATATEYAVMLAMIALGCIVIIVPLGQRAYDMVQSVLW